MMTKTLPYLSWITLGALLGLIAGQLFGPKSERAPELPDAHFQSPPLELERQDSTKSLYTTLPALSSASTEMAVLKLRDACSAKSPARQRTEFMRLLLELADDPDKTAQLIQHLQASATAANNHVRIISQIFKQWATRDPVAAMDAVATLKSHQLVSQAMQSTLKVWALTDPDAALAYVKEATLDTIARKGPRIILNALAELDPRQAFDAARKFGDADLERSLYHQVVAKKAETDIEQAWAEIEQLDDQELRATLRDSAISGLANSDKAAALAYVDQLTDPKKRQFHLRSIFRDWPLSNAEDAGKAFLAYPSEALVDGPAFNFGQTMNLADPQKALDFSESLQGEVRDQYLLGVLTEQAIKQPAETAEIVTQYLQAEDNLSAVYRHLGESWAGKDKYAAAQWLSELPNSPARDRAVSAFSNKLFSIDPERAIQWAMSINDEQERSKRMGRLVEQWQALDADAAGAWLEQSNQGEK